MDRSLVRHYKGSRGDKMTRRSGIKIEVRQAVSTDVGVTSELFGGYLEFYGVTAEPDRVRSFLSARIAQRDSVILLAEAKNQPALGFAQIYPTFSSLSLSPAWILSDLFVRSRARRVGVARALIRACLAEARQAGAVSIELKTAHDNDPARHLYEIEGFEKETKFVCYQSQIT
jgi:ribosomal protein S18 acetylase RimI-like enzyme